MTFTRSLLDTRASISKLIKYPSQAFEELGTIDLCNDKEIKACVEEVMAINEEVNFEEPPSDEPTLGKAHLHLSTLFLIPNGQR